MRTGGLSITHTNVTDTFQWPGASLLSSTNVRLSAVMSELEIVANGPSSDPVQHFTVLGVQGNNKAFKCLYCDKELSLLSQVSSACSCERSWSAYDFIHNRRRNRLTAARARDLVYVFTNGRLVDKISSSEEGFVGWDEEEEMEEDE
jgi:hypothetical protein